MTERTSKSSAVSSKSSSGRPRSFACQSLDKGTQVVKVPGQPVHLGFIFPPVTDTFFGRDVASLPIGPVLP